MLAGLAQRRLEATTKVADLQGGSGLLVPQECLRHGLLSVGGGLLVL